MRSRRRLLRSAVTSIAFCAVALVLPCSAQVRVRPAPADSGDGLLLHVSFDADRRAELAIGPDVPYLARYARAERGPGGGKHIEGVFGQALNGSAAEELGDYDALGNVNPERGTIAFFVRETQRLYGFEMLTINTVDPYYWRMYGRFSDKDNALSAWFANEVYRPHVLSTPGTARLKEGVWHHVAVTWDQAYGSRFYFDGTEVASNWGQATWFSRGVDLDRIILSYSDNVAYDELYIFDRPLTAQQIAALKERNRPPARTELAALAWDEAHRANRLRELSWERDDQSRPLVVLGRSSVAANAVRQVVPLQARVVKKEGNEVFDGKLGNGWPPLYNYEFNNGNGLHVELPEPYDLMTIEGRFGGPIYGQRTLTEEGAKPLMRINAPDFATHVAFPQTRPAGWLSFFKAAMEDKGALPDKELVTDSRICELGFFRTGAQQLDGATARACYIGPLEPAGPRATGAAGLGSPALQSEELLGRYGPGDRATSVLSTAVQSGGPGGQALPGLRYHHLIVPGAREDVPLRGLRLVWHLRGQLDDNALDVTVHDPLQPGRRLFHLDFDLEPLAGARAGAPQVMDFTLDLSDRLVPAGKPLWISFCFKHDTAVLWGGEYNSRVDLLLGTKEQVLPEYLRTELAFAKNRFREMSEPRPWGAHDQPEVDMPPFSREARELFLPLAHLWALRPEDPKVRALWLWTHKSFQDASPVEPLPVTGCENAPRWALLQRELFDLCTGVLYWWIENRQTPNGEFGDGWGDDTDLCQNFGKLALIRDPEHRLRNAVKLVADGVYRDGRIKDGINAHATDTLHAYEEGVNAQPVMALMDYGDPLYLERMMEAAKTVEERLTGINQHGRRRFRSWYFGADEVRDKGGYGADHPGNALLCHPALFLSFYSRQPRALKFLQEWTDGWLQLYERDLAQGLEYPSRTLFDDTQVISRDTKVRGYGYVDLYPALYRMTGERRYQEAVRFWTKRGSFMRGANYLPALEIIDWEKHRQDLIDWGREAASRLARVPEDDMGMSARQRLVEWEASGEERAAYEALEACLRKLRLTFDAHTWAEPINDRIWVPDHPMIVMMQGDMSHERNQLYPRHYVSYEGLSDFAAWVREKTDEHVRLWLYSFAPRGEEGAIRVWRTPLGRYRVTIGPDANGDGSPDAGSETREATLHRFAAIPLTLPPRRLMAVDITLIEKSREDFWARPDLAVTSDDAQWSDDGDALTVVLHNVGNSAARNVLVRLTDAQGKTLTERTVPAIEAPVDLVPRRVSVTLTGLKGGVPGGGVVQAQADPANALSELNEDNNAARVSR